MTRKQAKALQTGDKVCARLMVPNGADTAPKSPVYVPGYGYQYSDIPAGIPITFKKMIPKVRVVNIAPWQDSMDELLLCEMATGQHAWLGIKNAQKYVIP